MDPTKFLKKGKAVSPAFMSKFNLSRCVIVLSLFLLAVLLISFIFPLLNFGRFYGTDDYFHLFHTKEMSSSNGLSDFYDKMGTQVADPNSDTNDFNYPFGLWLFGSVISKITGLPVLNAEFLFVIIFLFILLGSFYLYSGIWLESKEQKIVAILFLLSMPTASLSLLSYRPSVFILPFLFIILYITIKEPIQWKLFPIVLILIFIITISHTGTFIFLVSFSIIFFLLYCLLWGKFSRTMFLVILSTFSIYLLTLNWFPNIANQYDVKSILFLLPGNLFASKFNFNLPLELGNVLYQNIIVDKQYVYAIIMIAFIFALGKTFMYIHRKVAGKFTPSASIFPVTIPSLNISKSIIGVPFWLGPIQLILSVFGIFRLDSRGKCIFITLFFITFAPDFILTSQGGGVSTGALREISYIILIVPITAVLGLWAIISYLDSLKLARKSLITFTVWVILLSAIIITPTMATSYYLPKISGEDYIIKGMEWLGGTGGVQEKVAGYGYRTVPIYTNKIDASYGIQNGYDLTTFIKLLKGTFFSSDKNNVEDLQRYYGVNYILVSDKLAENFGDTSDHLKIDSNPAVDKIYSSKDFGVYKAFSLSEKKGLETIITDNISLSRTGSGFKVETSAYKIILNENYPIIERFGTPQSNYLGLGIMYDFIQISGFRYNPPINPFLPFNESAPQLNSTVDQFYLNQIPMSSEISNNQVIYRTLLKDQVTNDNEATLLVRYTFYPKTVKREFLISNDWVTTRSAQPMNVEFSTSWFVPQNNLLVKSDQMVVLKRHIYPSEDSVFKNEYIQDLFIHDGNRGIDIKSEPTAPYPSQLIYKGSTLYSMSDIRLRQFSSVIPGDTMHVTQFLSAGDEVSTRRNTLTQEGMMLNNYPDGIVPIILSGYYTPVTGIGNTENIQNGYQILQDAGIPYSEFIVPGTVQETPVDAQNNLTSNQLISTPDSRTNTPSTIDTRTIFDENFKIIGKGSTGSNFFDNFSVQENSISSLINYANSNSITLIGYMPGSLNYNLDTLKIISDNQIPFIISRAVSPSAYGDTSMKDRNPHMASYQGVPVDVTLLPVSYPMSSSLSYYSDNSVILSAWKATIDEAMDDDEMVFFIFDLSDIGNPVANDTFSTLFSYAKKEGLTFTTPDVIVNHYRDLQKIYYRGSIDNDMASINLTNNNDHMVQHVTFRVVLPVLKSGGYKINKGEIVRTKGDENQAILYVSTDIPASATQEIVIEPETPREKIYVAFPTHPIEGKIIILIKDANGKPIENAVVVIDSNNYQPNNEGKVLVDMGRGMHSVEVQSPGYETYTSTFEVKGRFYSIENYLGNNS
jgi:hypothetical protein